MLRNTELLFWILYVHIYYVTYSGGKDSLVVWDQHNQQQQEDNNSPLLLYVADGLEEYSESWRLRKLIDMTGDRLFLGNALFSCVYKLFIH